MSIENFIRRLVILLWLCYLPACTPESGKIGSPAAREGEEIPLDEGKVRMTIRFAADEGIFSESTYPIDFSGKTVVVNGVDYSPGKDSKSGTWFVDIEPSPFGVNVAYLIEKDTPHQWFGEDPASDILIPNMQSLHRKADLTAIPFCAVTNPSSGDFLDFRPPFAVLDFSVPGDIVSLKLSSSAAVCGLVSYHRSDNSFIFNGKAKELVLNCTGVSENPSGHYPVMVFGQDLTDVKVRAVDRSHKYIEANLGDIELEPGDLRSFSLDGSAPHGLLWFEGFDLCCWGGDPVEGNSGLYPSQSAPALSGDDSLDGYEYARNTVDASFPGSGFIQLSFQDNASTVSENHSMSDSYIRSRGFDDYMYMLRCRECPGYISVGTGSSGRGIFSLYPLKSISSVKNLEVSFRICMDPSANDDVQFMAAGSSAVIREWYLDGEKGDAGMAVLKRTTSALTMDKETLGGGGKWKSVRVLIDNCTDATALQWQAASAEPGNHGFYLDDITVREVPGSWTSQGRLRILYWNIQNGMWANQYDYDDFVAFVNCYSPDICVWCEAKTNYESNSDVWISLEAPSYLPDNWAQLAKRYGHSYVGISRRDKEAFPQVVTSRYPVEKLLQLGYIEGEEPILHGAGMFRVDTPEGAFNFVTLHLNPYAEQDSERLREITRILDATLLNDKWTAGRGWFLLGDFNSHSRKDSAFIDLEESSPKYDTHDYIAAHTTLVDLIATRYPGNYVSTTFGYSRFDYIYMDAASYGRVQDAGVITTEWSSPYFSGLANFYIPSDHRPILVDLDY
ncbi:MAG: hypothetical protein IKR69_02235 [Bacteroidales bacterium]|nr:hypothetical protein [Bacteroidales bacterium]